MLVVLCLSLGMSTSVLVLGAGFGGLELSTRLSEELGDEVDVTLIDQSRRVRVRLLEARRDVRHARRPTPCACATPTSPRRSVRFRQETITAIDPVARRVVTDLDTYEADVLVVALGADYDLAATPGPGRGRQRVLLGGRGRRPARRAARRSGRARRSSACAVAPFKCPPAPSEAALLLDDFLRERGVRDDVRIQVVMPFGSADPAVARHLGGDPRGVRRAGHRVRARPAGSRRSTRPRARRCSTTARGCPTTCSSASRSTGRRRCVEARA